MVDTGIWSFPLTNVKSHSVTWPYTMTTPYWSDFVPNSTFYRIFSGFHRTFATDVACRQGTLTPPDTWSRPFGTCICSTCWDQSFFRTCRYFSGLCSSNIPRYFLDFALMTEAPTPTEKSEKPDITKTPPKRRLPTIADRLKTVSWSHDSRPTGVVKPAYGIPTFTLSTKAV